MILFRDITGTFHTGSGYVKWSLFKRDTWMFDFRRSTPAFPVESVRQDLRIGCFKEEP